MRRADRHDAKLVVHSNDGPLSAEDVALGYAQLMRVEQAWRQLKSGRPLRRVFRRAPHRIHAHAFLTVIALLLERVAEEACGDTWRNTRDDLEQIELAQSTGPNGLVGQVTEPRPEAGNRLKSRGMADLPTLVART